MKSKLRLCLAWRLSIFLGPVSIEVACEFAYRLYKGKWYFRERQTSARGLVQPHPYFGACLVPNVSEERGGVRITHNSFRCRGPEFARPKPPGKIRIATLGGSTTYCAGVSDDETWQHFLSEQLGTNYEVINMGAPSDGWLPFVRDRDLEKVIHAYNASLAKVAKEEGAVFGGEVLEPHYGEPDFIDNGHLSRSGNKLLANAMMRIISHSHVSNGRKAAP